MAIEDVCIFDCGLVGEDMNYIKIGKIINTHGIKGEVSIIPLTNDINRFSDLEIIYLGNKKIKVQIKQARPHKNAILLKFQEFDNINQVLSYVGDSIYIDEVEKQILPEDHFYIYDIVGSSVFNTTGEKIGVITEVNQYTSNDVYTIKNQEENKEYFIPAIKEFVVDVNIEEKKIVIEPIEGMIE